MFKLFIQKLCCGYKFTGPLKSWFQELIFSFLIMLQKSFFFSGNFLWDVSTWLNLGNVQKQPSIGFIRKDVLKICSKLTGEHPRRSAISIKLLCNFIEITIWHWCCSPVNLMHIFRTPFYENTSGGLLLNFLGLWKYTIISLQNTQWLW